MEFIRQIYNKFCKVFVKEYKETVVKSDNPENNIIFSIDIDTEYNRHMNIYIPDNIDEKNIVFLAEAYASTLLEIGEPSMQKQIINSLDSVINKDNPIESLLLDNIISLFVQYSQVRSDPSDPLIEPLSVFKK